MDILGKVTLAMKLAESAAACSLVNHLRTRENGVHMVDGLLSAYVTRRDQAGRAHLRESVVKFCTGTDWPVADPSEMVSQRCGPAAEWTTLHDVP